MIISKVQKREYLTAETLRKTTHVFWHSLELNHGYIWNKITLNYFEITSKLFQCFISHVTTSETEIELFQLLNELWNYFTILYLSDIEHVGKYPWASIIVWNNFEITLFHAGNDGIINRDCSLVQLKAQKRTQIVITQLPVREDINWLTLIRHSRRWPRQVCTTICITVSEICDRQSDTRTLLTALQPITKLHATITVIRSIFIIYRRLKLIAREGEGHESQTVNYGPLPFIIEPPLVGSDDAL